MTYRAPAFVEIKMDAEISSYQEDFDPSKDGPEFVEAKLPGDDLSPDA